MSDPIILSGYDDTWPAAFQQVATTIRRAFDAAELTIPRIDHIGSTAIPGIAAKPVIDIQISKIDLEPMTYRPALESLEYHWRAHNPELTKRMFRETRPMARTHIHVRRLGNWHEQFTLLFRDYLRVSASDADRYEAEKKRLPDNTRTTGLPTQKARGQSFWTSWDTRTAGLPTRAGNRGQQTHVRRHAQPRDFTQERRRPGDRWNVAHRQIHSGSFSSE